MRRTSHVLSEPMFVIFLSNEGRKPSIFKILLTDVTKIMVLFLKLEFNQIIEDIYVPNVLNGNKRDG
jgi:hypothetical protein